MVVEAIQKILIPRTKLFEGIEFYANRTDKALKDCQDAGFEPAFMPEIIDARIAAPKDAKIWQFWWGTPSITATGRTKQGTAVVVYAHVPNYFSNPNNITEAINRGLVNNAGVMPETEFQRLLDLEDGKNVFVVDYKILREAPSDIISLSKALKHPQTTPFLCGKERAEAYLERHKKVYGEKIGIWHHNDLAEKPRGRFLFLGYDCGSGLGSYDGLYLDGRFVGVRAEGAAPKTPSLEQVLKASDGFVPAVAKQKFEQRLTALYQ